MKSTLFTASYSTWSCFQNIINKRARESSLESLQIKTFVNGVSFFIGKHLIHFAKQGWTIRKSHLCKLEKNCKRF